MRGGLTTRDIQAHLREMYDVQVLPDLIIRVVQTNIRKLVENNIKP